MAQQHRKRLANWKSSFWGDGGIGAAPRLAAHRAAHTNAPGGHLNQTPGEGACVSLVAACAVLGPSSPKAPCACACKRPGWLGCRVGSRGGRHQGTRWPPRIDTRRGGPRITWCIWRRVGAPPISQAPPLFKHFTTQGSSERARGGWHQPASWQPRSDPRRALLALTFGSLCCFRGSATFQSLLRTNIFRK